LNQTKRCSRCKQVRNVSKFGKNRACKDGLNWYCLECSRQIARDRRLKKHALLFEKYNNKCALCECSDDLDIHHIKPTSQGGREVLENWILLCSTCHTTKMHNWRYFGEQRTCEDCGYVWIPRASSGDACPRCKSEKWVVSQKGKKPKRESAKDVRRIECRGTGQKPKVGLVEITKEIECQRCGHKWMPRIKVVRVCPKCRSPYWDRPREIDVIQKPREPVPVPKGME
jgi:predicted Zn-ribbon and HTH transcriptional regulator